MRRGKKERGRKKERPNGKGGRRHRGEKKEITSEHG